MSLYKNKLEVKRRRNSLYIVSILRNMLERIFMELEIIEIHCTLIKKKQQGKLVIF